MQDHCQSPRLSSRPPAGDALNRLTPNLHQRGSGRGCKSPTLHGSSAPGDQPEPTPRTEPGIHPRETDDRS